ncbi:MAG: phosphoglucosamine mutase [Desulfobacterales bacterium]|nr:phosphoglucosamine mutase [Desulfobacterales bacterium]
MGTLFGTDGIRGKANSYPITCDIAMKTGRAVGKFAQKNGFDTVIIGKDTRISGDMLEAAVAAGVASSGATALLAGVIPTPGVAFLCSEKGTAGAGVVLSASHNPYEDNGIKIFKHGGIKLTDDEEVEIENEILNTGADKDHSSEVGKIISIADANEQYANFLLNTLPDAVVETLRKKKIKLIVDCSNGAAFHVSSLVFNPDLFDVGFIYNQPDGKNINKNCGSQHTQVLQERVNEEQADIGLAFDGDADRLIAVDETGLEISGDRILAICSKFALNQNHLPNNIVVSTIMSNVGLTECLDRLGITHIKAGVGDRKVLEEMKSSDAIIGGEDSGHMIFLRYHSTGDGILSALRLLEVMVETGEPLSRLASIMTVYPQVLKNVEVDASRPDFMAIPPIAETIDRVEKKLGNKGRVLIRYSGTQPLLRVMVEGPDKDQTMAFCDLICRSIKENL